MPDWAAGHPAWLRLEDQLGWYDRKSVKTQKWYKRFKVVQISLAVSIPVLSHLPGTLAIWVISVAGASIAILEGVQHLNQFATLWVSYRCTAEWLKHEKFLFLAEAGPYKGLNHRQMLVLLAERVEQLVSTEHAKWINETSRSLKKPEGEEPRAA
ncbi:MAG: DUF4231 domain-containing protein [Candidatus Zixiibacteriota bacterium]|nr:MAG: DUF4231 domain-containing protein [candidate division Zixibacteria bacterium]